MTKINLIMLLLPFVFMVHEYEEIIMFRHWIDRNREELRKRFPKIESFFTRRGLFNYSTSTFAIGTVHEFILISVVSFCSVWTVEYQWWFAALTGYSVHLLIHILQWIVYRKYVPVIITSFLTLPYCFYAFTEFSKITVLSFSQMVLWATIGIVLTVLSLFSAFFCMGKFQRWEEKR
ncbi:HXXEE domain-containing protein [Prevotella koreensis]|uniref:HXXEE domain-containing protein n=1 Tax=Prevotella koreensis TaxID=2490854 RepID=A0A3S0R930_9BACT|nr:HXXEE domain-containing protein [Prevotella koreensis]RUL58362.1 HXXEE domain-containing protein [Prevotella koreensis]